MNFETITIFIARWVLVLGGYIVSLLSIFNDKVMTWRNIVWCSATVISLNIIIHLIRNIK